MPPISRYMTAQPWTLSSHASIAEARACMEDHAIRHLPIVDGGQLVGVLSTHDLAWRWLLDESHVRDVMTEQVLTAADTTPVDEVADEMCKRKCSSTVVMRGEAVLGIFTCTDACRVLADVLRRAVA